MRILKGIVICVVLLSYSCQKDEQSSNLNIEEQLENAMNGASDGTGKSYFIFPNETDLTNIPADPNNPLTVEKVELGRLLYHETALGIEPIHAENIQTYSCASCHFASAGFQAGRFQGIGEGGNGFGLNGESRVNNPNHATTDLDVQPFRSPTTLNVAYQTNMLWNGMFGATGVNIGTEAAWTEGTPKATNHLGFEGVETQAIAGLAVHRLDVDSDLLNNTEYRDHFDAAFSDVAEVDRYTRTTAGLAIAAYERTLLANESPFQNWLKGDANAMSEQQIRGALVFFDKGNCGSCHTGPALNSMTFHRIGMNDLKNCPEEIFNSDSPGADAGRADFTSIAEDIYKFKTPQLYNLKDSPFFGHGSSLRSVREVVDYKNKAVPEHPELKNIKMADEFVPLNLTEQEIDDLTEFIENGLYDPNLSRYEPTSLPSGLCFPNNDTQSKIDLGCD